MGKGLGGGGSEGVGCGKGGGRASGGGEQGATGGWREVGEGEGGGDGVDGLGGVFEGLEGVCVDGVADAGCGYARVAFGNGF